MKKFVSGVITGAAIGSAASMVVNSKISTDKKSHSSKSISKTLYNLGDMADNMGK